MATTAPATTKTCPGVKASGPADPLHRDPHTAPADEATFGKNAARPDGLGRVCKVCWPIYTKFLKTKAAGTTVTTEVDTTLAAISEPLAITDHDLVAAYDGKPGWSTEVVGTTRYAVPTESDTTGTDDGQAALSTWKKARDAQRKREERAAAKAAKA